MTWVEPTRAATDTWRTSGERERDRGLPIGRQQWRALQVRISAAPRRVTMLAAVAASVAGAWAGGPVAAVVAAAYAGLAARLALRRSAARAAEGARRQQLDRLCGLAADLRAGLPISVAMSAVATEGPDAGSTRPGGNDRISHLTRAAARLAEQTGAPLADLVERIEADVRATRRGLAAAAAQAAGARATAWLLAGLPLGGIALGYAIGVDPLDVLLRTPVGAGCAVGAIGLQFAGLAWADRLSSSATRISGDGDEHPSDRTTHTSGGPVPTRALPCPPS